jgi:hypothetical protein
MTAAAVEDGGSRQRKGQRMTVAVEDKGTQYWVADFIVEGTMVARDAGVSGVMMMALTVEDGGSRQQQ